MSRRLPAEWEAQSAIQFTFPHAESDWLPKLPEVEKCFARIIATVTRFQKALVVCQNEERTAQILANETDLVAENLMLVSLPSNDTWARDHAAITVIDDNYPVLLNFMFNGWGLKFAADKDNLISSRLFDNHYFEANEMEMMPMVLEGGGIESDGKGTLMTTASCMLSPNRNPHLTKEDIEEDLTTFFGSHRFLWLNNGYLAGDDTDAHIDTLARFCDENTIAYVACTDPDDEHFTALKLMADELKAFKKADGKPYNLVALPMADAIFDEEGQRLPATYANFLIINNAVLVPTYDVPQDAEALKILRGCFPDREIIGLDCRPLIWQHGSLHCITMQFPAGVVG